LSWEDKRVPPSLKTRYKTNTLPIPDEIEMRMSSVWGFDYYQPEELLLVRFDQEWDERYIRHTQRHTTFEPVDYSQVGQLIQQTTKGEPQKLLLKLWRKRPCDDAYYQAKYRQGDPNVMQRLRAWRPNIEIILPWSLRQQAAAEVEQERRLYYDCSEIDSLNATI
jgi:CRISPR-associated protein (TIGR03985 family)